MNNQDTIVGVVLICIGILLAIWEIRTFIRREQGALGYDVGIFVFGVGCIIWGMTLIF